MDLAQEVNEALSQYTDNIDKKMDQIFDYCARGAVDMLKSSSPKGKGSHSGSYARGWRVKKENGRYIVHNKTDYQLTHLLENGHDIVVNGRKCGHYAGQVHIKPVEEWVKEEVVRRLENEL